MDNNPILRVEGLTVHFPVRGAVLPGQSRPVVRAVEDVSFEVRRGETFGLIGESGCGKTTTGRALVGLTRPTGGRILLEGRPMGRAHRRDRLARALKVQMIFQESSSALDPRQTVGQTIREPLAVHRMGTAAEQRARTLALMEEVGLGAELYDRYPHEFSGGQRQRIGVARALALSPSLLVCDEPVSALDVSIQAQILNLLAELQRRHGLTYVFISHNLSVVRHLCDRVAVMYLGRLVELAPRDALFAAPAHPYTRALMSAIPPPDPEAPDSGQVLEGDVPSPIAPPPGCVFHTRCPLCIDRCRHEIPALRPVGGGHLAACHLADAEPL